MMHLAPTHDSRNEYFNALAFRLQTINSVTTFLVGIWFALCHQPPAGGRADRRALARGMGGGGGVVTCCRASCRASTASVTLWASWLVCAVLLRALKARPSAPSRTRICVPGSLYRHGCYSMLSTAVHIKMSQSCRYAQVWVRSQFPNDTA